MLKSNNWKKYSPEVILIECDEFDIKNIGENELDQFLTQKGYNFYSKIIHSVFYIKSFE